MFSTITVTITEAAYIRATFSLYCAALSTLLTSQRILFARFITKCIHQVLIERLFCDRRCGSCPHRVQSLGEEIF